MTFSPNYLNSWPFHDNSGFRLRFRTFQVYSWLWSPWLHFLSRDKTILSRDMSFCPKGLKCQLPLLSRLSCVCVCNVRTLRYPANLSTAILSIVGHLETLIWSRRWCTSSIERSQESAFNMFWWWLNYKTLLITQICCKMFLIKNIFADWNGEKCFIKRVVLVAKWQHICWITQKHKCLSRNVLSCSILARPLGVFWSSELPCSPVPQCMD